MGSKIVFYIGTAAIILLLVGSVFISAGYIFGNQREDVNNPSTSLDKYQSQDIPEECRLPSYEGDLEGWKAHLSHHRETLYCLGYYD